jgi:hypothetical protein
VVEEERLDVFSTLATGIAVTHMTDCHTARELGDLLLIEHLIHESVTFYSMEFPCRVYGYDSTSLLTSVLKSMQAIISKACSIINTIDSKYTTLVMKLVFSIFTITHIIYILFTQILRYAQDDIKEFRRTLFSAKI